MFPPCLRQSGPIKQELRFQNHRILIIHGPIETLDFLLIYIETLDSLLIYII